MSQCFLSLLPHYVFLLSDAHWHPVETGFCGVFWSKPRSHDVRVAQPFSIRTQRGWATCSWGDMESHHSRSIWGLRISQNAGGGEWKGQRLRNLEVCDVFSLEREAQLGRKVGEGKAENGDWGHIEMGLERQSKELGCYFEYAGGHWKY